MNKNKILGAINLILGLIYFLFTINYLFFVIPRMTDLYQQFSTKINLTSSYLVIGLLGIMGTVNSVVGYKVFKDKEEKLKNLRKVSILLIITAVLLSGFFFALMAMWLISPIYSLSTEL